MKHIFFQILFCCLIAFSCSKKIAVDDQTAVPLAKNTLPAENTKADTSAAGQNIQPSKLPKTLTLASASDTLKSHTISRDSASGRVDLHVKLEPEYSLQEVVVMGYGMQKRTDVTGAVSGVRSRELRKFSKQSQARSSAPYYSNDPNPQEHNTENYSLIEETDFMAAKLNALSTFSIDVDGASYSNCRRYLTDQGILPPKDAVRIEEFINYFSYDYPQPKATHPFAIVTEASECPWNKNHQLVHIGLQGKKYNMKELAPMNLVFLIDVSGSMSSPDKLPLLKQAFKLLVNNMRSKDRIAIVVYAGAAGLVLPATSGADKEIILNALERLSSGGSTAGGEGIVLAYQVAKENFIKEGINRVILATDGDFNVGVSSDAAMTRLVEDKRETGVFLTTLGFGTGNYKDSRMESMADHGNGNNFYIDNIQEAEKVFVTELDGTLCTIAKDVKLQVEFNPAKVKAYRLIGYENRKLNKEDFNDDRKDAGELGAGHSVTALYEIIPAHSKDELTGKVDELKYTQVQHAVVSQDLLTVKFRYKVPAGSTSKLIEQSLTAEFSALEKSSDNFKFSAAVAGYAMLLRDSKYKGDFTFDAVQKLALESKGPDKEGYRGEFIQLVKTTSLLSTLVQK